MKIILGLLFILNFIDAIDIDYKGNIQADYKKFNYNIPFVKDKNQKTILAQIELEKTVDNSIYFLKFEALKDIDQKDRKYNKLNEIYYKYEDDNYDLKLGKDIKYWGALELNNLSDVYNKKNIQNDPYDKDKKLGTKAITYNYYLENEDTISFITSEDKTQKHNSSVYLKYSGSRDDIVQRDFAYIINTKNHKFITFHTIVKDDTIYKLEYIYKNKIKRYQAGVGLEHTLYQIIDKKDLGLLAEYYKSNDDFTIYKNTIFTAMRLTFNDTSGSSILAGIKKDIQKNEYSKSLEYKTRFIDKLKLKLSYMKNNSLEIFGFNIGYYF